MSKTNRGFSLIEIMTVIAITGILASIVVFNVQSSGQKSRDAQRQADLRLVQSALEQYKNRYGRYPEGCNGVTTLATNAGPVPTADVVWSGQPGAADACTDSSQQYILGNPTAGRPFAEFLQPLPVDPRLNIANPSISAGYRYTTNEAGSVYKFMVKNTVEADDLSYEHPFKSCDVNYDFSVDRGSLSTLAHIRSCDPPNSQPMMSGINVNIRFGCDVALCDRLYDGTTYSSLPADNPVHCREGNPQFESSYAIWGGISHITSTSDFILNSAELRRVHVERQTENIICRLP